MANVKKCDKCKEYYDDEKFLSFNVKHKYETVSISFVITKSGGAFMDLCEACLAKEVSIHFGL